MQPKFLSVEQSAKHLEISRVQFNKLVKKFDIPCERVSENATLFYVGVLDMFKRFVWAKRGTTKAS